MNEKILKIFLLFVNRTDTFVMQQDDGSFIRVEDKLTADIIKQHLQHKITISVYQLDLNSNIKWVCFDIDDYASLEKAKILQNYIEEINYLKGSTLLEYTGGRGHHVWIFFKEKVPAVVGQELCSMILNETGILCEYFPKQTMLNDSTKYGNAVRLPLGFHRKYKRPSKLINPQSLDDIKPVRIPKYIVEEILAKRKSDKLISSDMNDNKLKIAGKIVRCPAVNDLLKGVEEGLRDVAAFALARFYKSLGLLYQETELLLLDWNNRNNPPLPEKQLIKCVKQAYRKKYTFGCNTFQKEPLLKPFCERNKDFCSIRKNILKRLEPVVKGYTK